MFFETNIIMSAGFIKTVFKTESIFLMYLFIYLFSYLFIFYAFAMAAACKSSLA